MIIFLMINSPVFLKKYTGAHISCPQACFNTTSSLLQAILFISRAPSDITLDAAKKQELLASLSALDDEEKSQIKPYQPSFLDSSRISTAGTRHESPSQLFNFEPVLDNPFNSASFKSLDSSINSVKSTVSVDSDKKAKLMRELFTTN